jgi:2-keto-3-deoxy-L-rhamnonate aldolase RhmA
VDNIHDILAVEGIDAVFVGRGDLAVATADREPGAPRTHAATEAVIHAARAAGKPACLFVSGADEARTFIALGATTFIVSSDQGLLRTAARQAVAAFDGWRRD